MSPRSPGRPASLRKRIADHPRTMAAAAEMFVRYIRFVRRTSRVDEDGWDEALEALDRHGSVIIVCWHQRLMMTPYIFECSRARFRSLTSSGRPGRLVGQMLVRFGYATMPMPPQMKGAAAMRSVLRGLAAGESIGISPDGPRGPARVAKAVPIQWARATGKPIVAFAFSARRFRTWPTWDRLMFPMPFNRLALLWRVWEREIPTRPTAGEVERLTLELQDFMNRVTAEADARVGHARPQT